MATPPELVAPGVYRVDAIRLSNMINVLLLENDDAFGSMPRKLKVGVRRTLCNDPAQAKRSAEKLLAEEFGTVIFAHGKTLRTGAQERLREVVARSRH